MGAALKFKEKEYDSTPVKTNHGEMFATRTVEDEEGFRKTFTVQTREAFESTTHVNTMEVGGVRRLYGTQGNQRDGEPTVKNKLHIDWGGIGGLNNGNLSLSFV